MIEALIITLGIAAIALLVWPPPPPPDGAAPTIVLWRTV